MQSQAPLAEDTISRDHTPTRGLETALSPARGSQTLGPYKSPGQVYQNGYEIVIDPSEDSDALESEKRPRMCFFKKDLR